MGVDSWGKGIIPGLYAMVGAAAALSGVTVCIMFSATVI